MTTMFDIFGPNFLEELELELQNGYIRERSHPVEPHIGILNYTEKAAFEGHWNNYTLNCRGLIVDRRTHTILARPFPKFFNYGQEGAPEIDLDAELFGAYDKADGSLGIVWKYGLEDDEDSPIYGLNIATRGSFESEQAIWATEWMKDNWEGLYDDAWQMIDEGYTPLVEIIYPENRIVLDYHGAKTLKHLGYVAMSDARYTGVPTFNPILSGLDFVTEIPARTFRDVLTLPVRENAEGIVAWVDEYTAVKIKQQDYIELHRIVTGLNRKSIWRAIVDGTYEEKAAQFPDELYAWADGVRSELELEFSRIHSNALAHHIYVTQELRRVIGFEAGAEWTQKEFALKVQEIVPKEYQGLVFLRQAGKRDQVDARIWAMIEPIGGDK